MCTATILLMVTVAPLAFASAFVPTSGSCRAVHLGATFLRWTGDGSTAVSSRVPSMQLVEGHRRGIDLTEESSRVDFLRGLADKVSIAAAGVAVAELTLGTSPAIADSTGKYSTKTTARKRYLPRIAKLVKGFEQLRQDIDARRATPSDAFFVDILPDALAAMDLFGSSMKRGEYPDSKSKGLQKLASDFGTACGAISKSLATKGGGDPVQAYDKAASILADYLKGTELDPIGSASYNT